MASIAMSVSGLVAALAAHAELSMARPTASEPTS
jgi:hypothetical protein